MAARELVRDPELVFDVMQARAYARAKATYDQFDRLTLQDRTRLSSDPMIQLVMQTDFEVQQQSDE